MELTDLWVIHTAFTKACNVMLDVGYIIKIYILTAQFKSCAGDGHGH